MVRDFTATLLEKKNLTGQVWQFRFQVDGEPLAFKPGQYVLLKIDTAFRQYSISSNPQDGTTIEFIIEYIPGGLASTYLDGLAVGQQAGFKGPAGIFMLKETQTPKIFLATGTGIAPVMSMITYALTSGHSEPMRVYFGLKTRTEMYLYDEFMALHEAYHHFNFQFCLSREESLDGLDAEHISMGRIPHVLDAHAAQSHEDRNSFEYYVCGSKEIVTSLKEHLAEKGVAREMIFSEMFG